MVEDKKRKTAEEKKKPQNCSETHGAILVTGAAPPSHGPLIGLDQRNTRSKQISIT